MGAVLVLLSLLATAWFNIHPFAGRLVQDEILGWWVKLSSALLLCYIADASHPRSRLLSQAWLRWFGIISYEWYLFHQPIIYWAKIVFGPAGGNTWKYFALVGGSLVFGLGVAAVVYRCFSLPILKRGRKHHSASGS